MLYNSYAEEVMKELSLKIPTKWINKNVSLMKNK